MAEVALFVDFENIRYGVRNTYRRELSVALLAEKAKKYGTLRVAKAYADFSTEHPPKFMRELQILGIEPVNLPKRQVSPKERKNSADIHIVMDMIETLLERPSIETYILMGGDRDYVRIVALARNRFAKKVVVSAVPGTISQDLAMAAGSFDPFELSPIDPKEQVQRLIRKVKVLEQLRPYVTFKFISDALWTDPAAEFISLKQCQNFVSDLVSQGVLEGYPYVIGSKQYKALRLNEKHPLVIKEGSPTQL